MTATADRRASVMVAPLLVVLPGLASAALLLWVSLKPSLAGINSDAAVYVLLADWLSPWQRSDIGFGARLFEHYPFPPLYPLLLAALGAGSSNPLVAYGIDAVLQALAVAASGWWALRAGFDRASVMLAALSLALTPIALFTAMGLFSEPLYLALSMSALAILAGPEHNRRHWYIAAVLLGCAALTRGVGLFAIAALLLVWAWRTSTRSARLTPLLALVAPLSWMAFKAAQGWQGSYTHNLFGGETLAVLHALLEQLPTNLRALHYHFVRCFDSLGGRHSAVLLSLLLVPATYTWIQRLRAAQLDACYAALYVGVIVLWPYPNHFARFLLVLLPLFAAYAGHGMGTLLRALGPVRLARHGAALTAVLLLLVVAPSVVQVVSTIARADDAQARLETRISSWYSHDSHAAAVAATAFSLRVLTVMAELGERLPRDACVSSTMAEVFMLHSRRYSRPPPSQRDDVATLRGALADCPYVLLLGATAFPAADFPAFYPAARLPGELTALYSVARDPTLPDAPALAILARYRGPSPGPHGR